MGAKGDPDVFHLPNETGIQNFPHFFVSWEAAAPDALEEKNCVTTNNVSGHLVVTQTNYRMLPQISLSDFKVDLAL